MTGTSRAAVCRTSSRPVAAGTPGQAGAQGGDVHRDVAVGLVGGMNRGLDPADDRRATGGPTRGRRVRAAHARLPRGHGACCPAPVLCCGATATGSAALSDQRRATCSSVRRPSSHPNCGIGRRCGSERAGFAVRGPTSLQTRPSSRSNRRHGPVAHPY